jgi:hypothetical protein
MFCHIRWFSVRKLELSGEGIVNAPSEREEVNQPPLCIPTISQPIHAKAEHPSFNATSKIRFNCRVRAQRNDRPARLPYNAPMLIRKPFTAFLFFPSLVKQG